MTLKTRFFIAARLDSHNKRFLLFQARHETNLKTKAITKHSQQGLTNKNRNDLPRTKNIKWKTLPTLPAKRDCQKMTACKTTSLKNLLKNQTIVFANYLWLKKMSREQQPQKASYICKKILAGKSRKTWRKRNPKTKLQGRNLCQQDFIFWFSHRQMPNGLRYPRVGGRGQCLRCRKNPKPEKCS